MEPRPYIIELYKLAVEMADRVSARRAAANGFFFTVQAGLAVALGAFAINTGAGTNAEPDRFVLMLAALAGVIIAASWWLLLWSYRTLNSAKFAVIRSIEQQYFDIRLFDQEWETLKRRPTEGTHLPYINQGAAERVVPLVFLALYATLAVYVTVG